MIRAVIFDYGNTLIGIDPSTPSWRTDYADVVARPGAERLAEHLAGHGLFLPHAERERFIDRFLEIRERNRKSAEKTGSEITAETSLSEALADAGARPTDAVLLREAIAVNFTAEEERIVELAGATETLQMLRAAGARIALLSNATDGRYVERVAARLGMRPFFDPFIVSADIGVRKPHAEAFRAVLDRWALPAASIAMVGDSLHHDIGGANRLGLYSIHYIQIANPGDPAYRETIVPRAAAGTHEALRRTLAPLLLPGK